MATAGGCGARAPRPPAGNQCVVEKTHANMIPIARFHLPVPAAQARVSALYRANRTGLDTQFTDDWLTID
jgi:hypothetical protein